MLMVAGGDALGSNESSKTRSAPLIAVYAARPPMLALQLSTMHTQPRSEAARSRLT